MENQVIEKSTETTRAKRPEEDYDWELIDLLTCCPDTFMH